MKKRVARSVGEAGIWGVRRKLAKTVELERLSKKYYFATLETEKRKRSSLI